MLMNILIEVFDIAKGLGGACLVALLLSSFASNGLVLPPLSLFFNVPQSASSLFCLSGTFMSAHTSRIGCKVTQKGPKWPKLVKVPAVHHLGPFWVHVDPLRTFSGKNQFSALKTQSRSAKCI